MPCYEPLQGFLIEGPEGRRISFKYSERGRGISLPCGRCVGCRLERARQWSVRIMHEAELHENSCFVTLTYRDVPADGSLSKKHCQDFMKRLRERIAPVKVRYFLCGEYGEKFARPHYHMILFGYDFPDKVKLKNDGEHALFRSDELDSCWQHGFCSIGKVTFDSACYCANYAQKKVVGKKAAEHYGKRLPEFLLMSRRPGIGRGWIEMFQSDVYPSDEVIVRGRKARPPRYYDQVVKENSPELMDGIKAKRDEAQSVMEDFVYRSPVTGERITMRFEKDKHPLRLKVLKRVAEAKLRLKTRKLENDNA